MTKNLSCDIMALFQRVQPLDFSTWNLLADQDFRFYDSSLVEAVKVGEPTVHEFFRLLSLCHTVMSEEKNEGNKSRPGSFSFRV